MSLFRRLLAGLVAMVPSVSSQAASPEPAAPAAEAINALGLDLLGRVEPTGNSLLSPFSIQAALAMTYAGADGETRAEMRRVLHFPEDEAKLHAAFEALRGALEEIAKATSERAEQAKKWGGPQDPVILTVANRLFGQDSFQFRPPFLELVRQRYQAPLQPMNFAADPNKCCADINAWVEEQTRQRIKNLLPSLTSATRLVLVNAIYLKAPWAKEFNEGATAPRPFHVDGGAPQDRPTMMRQSHFGYRKLANAQAVTVPYSGGGLQLLVLVPDAVDGLAALEKSLTPALLGECSLAPTADVILQLPKFKLEPPLMSLGAALGELGMKQAFDVPKASANFERMAPRQGQDYLYISAVFHKTFLALDEKGTEAAAATAVLMAAGSAAPMKQPDPIELKVDRPFLFAIQHRASGACLFLGRVSDPK